MRKPVKIIITVMSIIFVLFLIVMVFVVLFCNSDADKTGEIVVELYEEPTKRGYEYEVLDPGIIELKEKKKTGGNWGAEYKVTWTFKIIKDGIVRIKWINPDSVQKWKNSESWIDTYIIDADNQYKVERYYLMERVFYLMCYPVKTDKGSIFKGYFVDINGAKRYYSIEDSENMITSINDLHKYLSDHFCDFEAVECFKNIGLKNCNLAMNKIEDHFYLLTPEFEYGKCTLYGVQDVFEIPQYVVLTCENKSDIRDENIEAIMNIFGEDWNQYKP